MSVNVSTMLLIYHNIWANGQISTLRSVNPFFPSFTRTGFSVLVCQTSIWRKKTQNKSNISKLQLPHEPIQSLLPLSSSSTLKLYF